MMRNIALIVSVAIIAGCTSARVPDEWGIPSAESSFDVGIRACALLPQEYETTPFRDTLAVGVFMQVPLYTRVPPFSALPVAFEVSLKWAETESESGLVESTLMFYEGACLIGPREPASPRLLPYFVVGAGGLTEQAYSDVDLSRTATTGEVFVGAGLSSSSWGLDLRLTYVFMPKSENVKGLLSLSMGLSY